MQAVKELLTGSPTSVRFTATPVKLSKNLFAKGADGAAVGEDPPFRIEGRLSVAPRRRSPRQPSLWKEQEEADLCPRHREHRQTIEELEESRLAQRQLRESLHRPPLWRVPVVKEPLPVDVEDFNPIEPSYSKFIQDVWLHARDTVQNPQEASGFEDSPAGQGVLPTRAATADNLGWVRPRRRASSFYRWTDSPSRVGRPLSPVYKAISSSGATVVSAEGYPQKPFFGELRSRGMHYRSQYELPTLSSILKARHAVFVKAKNPQEETPSPSTRPSSAAPRKLTSTKMNVQRRAKTPVSERTREALSKPRSLEEENARGPTASSLPKLRVSSPSETQKVPPSNLAPSQLATNGGGFNGASLLSPPAPTGSPRVLSPRRGSPRCSPTNKAPLSPPSSSRKEAVSSATSLAKKASSSSKDREGERREIDDEELAEFKRWKREHRRRISRAERLASPEIMGGVRPLESCQRCLDVDLEWACDGFQAHLHTARKAGPARRSLRLLSSSSSSSSSEEESETEDKVESPRKSEQSESPPAEAPSPEAEEKEKVAEEQSTCECRRKKELASAVPIHPQALLVQPLPKDLLSDNPARDTASPKATSVCGGSVVLNCCGRDSTNELNRSREAEDRPGTQEVLLLQPPSFSDPLPSSTPSFLATTVKLAASPLPSSTPQQSGKTFQESALPPTLQGSDLRCVNHLPGGQLLLFRPTSLTKPAPLPVSEKASAGSAEQGGEARIRLESAFLKGDSPSIGNGDRDWAASSSLPAVVVATPASITSPFRRAKPSKALTRQLPPLTTKQMQQVRDAQLKWWWISKVQGASLSQTASLKNSLTDAERNRIPAPPPAVSVNTPSSQNPQPNEALNRLASSLPSPPPTCVAPSSTSEKKLPEVPERSSPEKQQVTSQRQNRRGGGATWKCGAELEMGFNCGGSRRNVNSSCKRQPDSSSAQPRRDAAVLRRKATPAKGGSSNYARNTSEKFLKVPKVASSKALLGAASQQDSPKAERHLNSRRQDATQQSSSLKDEFAKAKVLFEAGPKAGANGYSCGLYC